MFQEVYNIADLLKDKAENFLGINGTFPRETKYDHNNHAESVESLRKYVTVELNGITKEIIFTIAGLANFEDETAEDEDSYDGRVCGGDIYLLPSVTSLTEVTTQFGDSLQEQIRYAEYLIDETLTYEGTEYRLIIPMHED